VFRAVVEFASAIGMVPIEVRKEKSGDVLNSLLVPFLNYAEPEAVDKTWRIATGAPMGPFQILDVIGLTTPYNILSGNAETAGLARWLKENYIDKGRLGVATGEGFYKYS
jgi:3-hydroxybutyryl-CoA dehydrogenase